MAKRKKPSGNEPKATPKLAFNANLAGDTLPPEEYREQELTDQNDAQTAYLAKHGDEISKLYESIRSGSSASAEEQNDDHEIRVEEHPQVVFLKQWLAIPGLKDCFWKNVQLAESWQLEVDQTHKSIAFYIECLFFDVDPTAAELRRYLFEKHRILPSESVDLSKLLSILEQDGLRQRTARIPESHSSLKVDGSIGDVPKAKDDKTVDSELGGLAGDVNNPAPVPAAGYLGGRELADAFGIPKANCQAFLKRLERFRRTSGDCWQEISNPKPNSPRYLFQTSSPLVRKIAEEYRNSKAT